jgi:hypothetical protein
MFKDKYVILDGKTYKVTFAGSRCAGVLVQVSRLRGIHRETFWRVVYELGNEPSRMVTRIIAMANANSQVG